MGPSALLVEEVLVWIPAVMSEGRTVALMSTTAPARLVVRVVAIVKSLFQLCGTARGGRING